MSHKNSYEYWSENYSYHDPLIVNADKLQEDIESKGAVFKQAYSLWSTGKMKILYIHPQHQKHVAFPRAIKIRDLARIATPLNPMQESIYNLTTKKMTTIRSDGNCSDCRKKFVNDVTIEHRYPKFIFPKDTFNPDNWTFSCAKCNRKKGVSFEQEISQDIRLAMKIIGLM